MKVILNYDKTSGNITDKNGTIITSWMGLEADEFEGSTSKVGSEKLVELKEAGFEFEEIMQMQKKGML